MSEQGSPATPRTEAGRRLLAKHRETKTWPSTRDDPAARADGYVYYCKQCLGRSYPCDVVTAILAIEAEAEDAAAPGLRDRVADEPLFPGAGGGAAADAPPEVTAMQLLIDGAMLAGPGGSRNWNHQPWIDRAIAFVTDLVGLAPATAADAPIGDEPDSLKVNGHLFVHVAACPCPRIQAEVTRLAATADTPEATR